MRTAQRLWRYGLKKRLIIYMHRDEGRAYRMSISVTKQPFQWIEERETVEGGDGGGGKEERRDDNARARGRSHAHTNVEQKI